MAIIKKIFLEPKDPKCLGIKIDGVQYPAKTAKEANGYQIKRLLSNNQYKVYEELVVDGNTYHIPLSIKNFDTDNTSECTTSNMVIEIPSAEEEVVESIPEQLVEEKEAEAKVADKVEITDSAVVTKTHEEPDHVEQDEEIKEKEVSEEQVEVVRNKVEVKKQAVPVQPKQQPVQQQNNNQNKHNNNKQNFNKQNKQQLPKANTEL